MPRFRIKRRDGSLDSMVVKSERFVVGRHRKCDLSINDQWASRYHTVFFQGERGGWFVEDLGSENGTFLNGHRVQRALVYFGDVVRAGTTELRFDPSNDEERRQIGAERARLSGHDHEETVIDSLASRRRLGPELMRLLANPRTRATFPFHAATSNNSSSRPRRPIVRPRWCFLGVGAEGDRLGSELLRLGYDRVAVVVEGLVPPERILTPKAHLLRLAQDVVVDLGADLASLAPELRRALGLPSPCPADLFLLGAAENFGDRNDAIAHVTTLRAGLFEERDAAPVHVHAVVGVDDQSRVPAAWSALVETGDICSVVAYDRAWSCRRPAETKENTTAITVAGVVDLLRRLSMFPPLSGRWTAIDLARFLHSGGEMIVGLAETDGVGADDITEALRLATGDGLMRSRARIENSRRCALFALVGSECLDDDPELADRVDTALDQLADKLSTIDVDRGVFEFPGSRLRFVLVFGM